MTDYARMYMYFVCKCMHATHVPEMLRWTWRDEYPQGFAIIDEAVAFCLLQICQCRPSSVVTIPVQSSVDKKTNKKIKFFFVYKKPIKLFNWIKLNFPATRSWRICMHTWVKTNNFKISKITLEGGGKIKGLHHLSKFSIPVGFHEAKCP